ncbi:MAG: oxygenase MpaB family protein [Flavobacteriales bacterium]
MTTKWNDAFLKEMIRKSDALADDLVAKIITTHGIEEIKKLFTQLTDNNDILANQSVLPEVIAYFNHEINLPAWADEKQIALAQEMFAKNGPEIAFLLNFRSLPLCYSSRNGAKVFYSTGRLRTEGHNTSKIVRRLMETSQMVINVMAPGGLSPQGKGIVTVKKVRLMHAAIRYYLMHPHINKEGWDVESFGIPINQEEMAGTLMAFGPLVAQGLDLLGIETTTEEKDAYLHCWKVVGHFIGVDPKLFPVNHEDGWNLGLSILIRNQHESEEAKALANSLDDFGKIILPFRILDDMPEYFIQRFTRDVSAAAKVDFSKLIGIQPKRTLKKRLVTWFMEKAFDASAHLENKSRFFAKIVKWLNMRIMQGMVDVYLKNTQVEFYIPPSLKENWQIK